jgi:trans-aconitate methyltransferase
MSNLYSNLAQVYEGMYKTFIDYEDEFNLYKQLLQKYNCNSLIEIGCGTGNLAGNFIKNKFEYTGLDISEDMLRIAKKNHPDCSFLQADMQFFKLPKPSDAAIITGRTISYLLTNTEVLNCLNAIHDNLNEHGILCFDFIDANMFIPLIGDQCVIHKAAVENKNYTRESYWKVNHSHSWAFDWNSIYYEELQNGKCQKIGEDNATIRCFTKDDIVLFLTLSGYRLKEMKHRSTYAFDTFVLVAEKIN